MDEIFAHNVIQHIMSGKAYARALCGHLLIYAALQKLIFDDMVNQDQISSEELDIVANSKESDDSDEIKRLTEKIQNASDSWKEGMSEHRTTMY